MTVGEALAQRSMLGIPNAGWLLIGGIAFYLLMHRMQNSNTLPSIADKITSTVGGIGSGIAQRPQIYMPDFPMPVVNGQVYNGIAGEQQYAGVHY